MRLYTQQYCSVANRVHYRHTENCNPSPACVPDPGFDCRCYERNRLSNRSSGIRDIQYVLYQSILRAGTSRLFSDSRHRAFPLQRIDLCRRIHRCLWYHHAVEQSLSYQLHLFPFSPDAYAQIAQAACLALIKGGCKKSLQKKAGCAERRSLQKHL